MSAAPPSSPTVADPESLRADATLAAAVRLGVLRLARRLRVERESDDLSFSQLAVLGTLARCGALTPGELATAENVKPPSMTRTVCALEEAGLVTRRPHDRDGRQVVVELTDGAHVVLEGDRQRRTEWLLARLDLLDADERELLRRVTPLLERLAAS